MIAEATPITRAQQTAEANLQANLSALADTQPRLLFADIALPAGWEWIFGRDGTLTARSFEGQWWGGCSLPRRAAEVILKSLDASGRTVCFLRPPFAAQIRLALEKTRADQAIIALVPSIESLSVILHGEDFSADLRLHRLWFAWGEKWPEELATLFDENPGLPTPAQFVRGAAADKAEAEALIPAAQQVFAAVGVRRSQQLVPLRKNWRCSDRTPPRCCVVAPSHFRLWDDGGDVLAKIFAEDTESIRFDSDDPASASPLILAESACQCDAVVSVNLAREDLGDVLPPEMPWVTWITRPRLPAATAAGKRDGLIVADVRWRRKAVDAGWPADRVEVAGWPALEIAAPADGAPVYLIADTRPLKAPAAVLELSSQNLLWEAIASELLADPLRVGGDPEKFLNRRRQEMRIGDGGFDAQLFLDQLIVPAFQQGMARLLIRKKTPLRLRGRGWDEIDEFAAIAGGPIDSRAQWVDAVTASAGLVFPSPLAHAHPIDALPRPIVRPAGSQNSALAALDRAIVLRLLARLRG
jgi:hypothetical protein